MQKYPSVASLKTHEQFQSRLSELGLSLQADKELDAGPESPLGQPMATRAGTVGNRFAILPMEGWDGTTEGQPTELTLRRWENFGASGAKLIWGGEAVAIRPDGRANPNQLMLDSPSKSDSIKKLNETLRESHRKAFGNEDGLVVGLQLTHSGRFARPNRKDTLEPKVAYRHSLLDKRSGGQPIELMTDEDLQDLIQRFIVAAKCAEDSGFQFVDVKHCHGYLGHELLSGFDREGKYGGSFENRTRFLREIVEGIRGQTGIQVGVRLSMFDFAPYSPGDNARIGVSEGGPDYRDAFGPGTNSDDIDFEEPFKFMELLRELEIDLICTTAGSPYYNPHIQRPAAFPPSDGYFPPEDPLVGVDRQITATAKLKAAFSDINFVGSGYSYLQDWLPHVGQRCVREGQVDSIGLGRMVLSYPELPADVLGDEQMKRKKICRTFSDCTTAPRNGMISGCFPLDPFYKVMPERKQLIQLKKQFTEGKS